MKIYPQRFSFFKEPQLEIVTLFLVGFTLAFHLVLTFDSLRTYQPDIRKTGIFLSLVLVLMANVIVIAFVLKLVSPNRVSLDVFFKESLETTANIWSHIILKFSSL